MFRYADDVLSLNNSKIDDFVGSICPIETEITNTTDTAKSDVCLGLSLEIHSEGQLRMKLNDIVKKSLKIPMGQSESIYQSRRDNMMAKRKSTKGQTTINKKHTYKTKDRVTRNPLQIFHLHVATFQQLLTLCFLL